MSNKRGRPPNQARKHQKVTWVKLPEAHRRILNADFGSYQAGLEKLVRRYIERREREQDG